MRRLSTGQLLLAAVAVLLIVSAAILAWPKSQEAAPPASVDQVPRVSLDDARAAFDSGAAVFIDVRGANDYAASHIPGSLSIPLAEIGSSPPDVDPSTWIITYCT